MRLTSASGSSALPSPAAPFDRRLIFVSAGSTGTVVACAILLGLGTWQAQRLAWKTDLIATLETRRAAPSVALGDVLGEPAAYEFRRAVATGRFAADGSFFVANRTHRGQVGGHVVTPFHVATGGVVLVNRGWVPTGWHGAAPTGERTIEGFVRQFSPAGRFTPANDAAGNVWYSIDAGEMAAAAGLDALVPLYLMAVPGADPEQLPAGVVPGVNLRNNHLGYAITWYGLAAAVVGLFVAAHLRRGDA